MADLVPLLRAALKTAAGTNPVTGLVAQALEEYAQEAHDRATAKAAELTTRRIAELGYRIDVQCVKTDQFFDLFKNLTVVTSRTQYEEKYRAAANILGNALLKAGDADKLPFDELDHFTRCIENLSISAIRVLHRALERGVIQDRRHRDNDLSQRNVRIEFGQLRADLGEPDADLLLGLVGELNSFNLLHLKGIPGIGYGDGEQKYHNYPVETTPLGHRFKKFILDP